MSFKKIVYLSIIFIVFLTCFSTVHASDLNESDNADLLTIKYEDKVVDSELLADTNPGSFKDLAAEIGKVGPGGTLNLTRNYFYSSGDSAVVIDKKITINGNGFKIDGSGSSQIFRCYGDEKIFNNIVFSRGHTDDNGGAIYSESKLTLNNCVFDANFINVDYYGVAIYSTSDVYLESCTFKNHWFAPDYPYLIYSNSVSVKNSKFFDNKCDAILYLSNLIAVNSEFLNNGGSSFTSNSAKYTYIKNCNFIGNHAFELGQSTSSVMRISSEGSYTDMILEDCKFINNTGSGKTAIFYFINGVINNCEFIGNSGTDGSGICSQYSNLKLKNVKFESNRDRTSGGAIYCFQSKVTIESCDFINNYASEGGAIRWDCQNSRIVSCNFINNTADIGGAISDWNVMENYIEKSSFSKNSANNGKIISFSNHFFTNSQAPYVISSISDNNFDDYYDMYGGSFSFRDNILTIKHVYPQLNLSVAVDGKMVKGVWTGEEYLFNFSYVSPGIHNAKLLCSGDYPSFDFEMTMPLIVDSYVLQVSDVNKTYGGPESLEIDLKSIYPMANENVQININGVDYTRTTDSNGHASLAINLNAGVYDATVTYRDITKKANVTVNHITTRIYLNVYKTFSTSIYMNVTVENASDGDRVVFNLNRHHDGTVKEYECIIKNSQANLHLSNIKGWYLINASYHGDVNHQISSNATSFVISGMSVMPSNLPGSNYERYYGDSDRFKILRFFDEDQNPLYMTTADIYIDNVKYVGISDINGIMSIDIGNLKSGRYLASTTYDGENCGFYFTIKPTVFGNDVTAQFGDVTYTANFIDSKGNALTNGTATFKIGSQIYYSTISNGFASINLNLNCGWYVVEVTNPVTGESISNYIHIIPLSTTTQLYDVKDINPGDKVNLTAFVSSNVGVVVFAINSTNKTVNVVDHMVSCTFTLSRPGSYVARATYVDPEGNYLSSMDSKSFKVFKFDPDISVVADDIGTGQNAIFEIAIAGDAEGEVSVLINNKTYKNLLYNGKTIISVPDLTAGSYAYDIVYSGNEIYNSKKISGNITVFIINVVLNVQDLVKYYSSSTPLTAQLLDKSGNPLIGEKIIFTVNDNDYERITNNLGIGSMDIDLACGNYSAGVRFDGKGQYDSIKTVVQIEIKPTVKGNDLSKIFRNDAQYYATFVDSMGNLLKNAAVEFNIGGVVYKGKTNEKGTAYLNIDLNAGEYIITATNPSTGEIHTNKITVLPVKTETKLLDVKNINIGDSLTVTASVNSSVGAVVFSINSSNKTVDVVNNNASYTIDALNVGDYVIKATYVDHDGNYLSSSDSKSFTVSKRSPDISVVVEDIGVGQNAIFEIVLSSNATGQVSVKINNKTYINQLHDGKTIVSVPDLDVGNYGYDIEYTGDNIYSFKKISGHMNVFIINVVLKTYDLVKYYSSSTPLSVQLLDNLENPLAGQKILFTLNNRDYERTTNNWGIASMNININSGNYTARVTFNGTEQYDSIKTMVQIEIKPTVAANDFTKIFRNDTQYYAAFVDSKGNLLKDTSVEFNINGVFYNRKTNENGIARLNINLNPGEYILTARNPSTGELHSTRITVLPSIVENKDITKYYKNATQYSVKVIGADGKPVGAGETVKFNINGVIYERRTNESGIAKININLVPGDYVITAEYRGYKVANNISVLPVLYAKDITMKYRDGTQFVAILVDGQAKPYANQTVQFNINGVMYNRPTDESGLAKLNINLIAGKYIITSSYNGANIANKITITA